MAPLTVAGIGDECIVKKLGGLEETKHHLANMGFTEGCVIRVVSKLDDNYIVAVRDARVALDARLASKIYI